MTWLEELVNQHSELESPVSFWYWAGLTAISAVVKDNVWIDRQIYKLYPNVYVLFHADSGLKKGPPVNMAKKLVTMVNNTRIISGRSSIQGILKDLGTAQTKPGQKPLLKSVAFICSSELSSSIVEDPVATKILTDLYDRNYNEGEWRSLLKMESFTLKDPTVTMLTATNESMSEEFFTKAAIHGGYFARTFVIYETKRNRANSLLVSLTHPPNLELSANYLKQLSKLQGPFQALGSREKIDCWEYPYKDRHSEDTYYFTRAGIIYQQWYDDFLEVLERNDIRDDTGTLNRFGDSVLKVAMLLSLAKEPNLIIDEQSMNEAISKCEKLIGNVREMTHGKKGISQSKLLKGLIVKELLNRESHMISRTVLMKKMWAHYSSSEEFDDIMESFDSAGLIKVESVGNQVIYRMPDDEAEELKKFFEGKNK